MLYLYKVGRPRSALGQRDAAVTDDVYGAPSVPPSTYLDGPTTPRRSGVPVVQTGCNYKRVAWRQVAEAPSGIYFHKLSSPDDVEAQEIAGSSSGVSLVVRLVGITSCAVGNQLSDIIYA